MDTDQARSINDARLAHERASANLANAVAMSAEEPKAQQILEDAGDAFVQTRAQLTEVCARAEGDLNRAGLAPVADIHATEAPEPGEGGDGTLVNASQPPAEGAEAPQGGQGAPQGGQTPAEAGEGESGPEKA